VETELERLLTGLKPRILSFVFEDQFGFEKSGKSSLLGGEHDRELLVALRRRADLIVTSGKTAEIEGYRQPRKPLVILSTRPNAAPWLDASRLTLSSPELKALLKGKNVLFETGLSLSRMLMDQKLIDQVVVHHDLEGFEQAQLDIQGIIKINTISFFDRYISVFERRGR